MSKHFIQSAVLRRLALAGLRAWLAAKYGGLAQKIFVNSIPKAGTHLLTAELAGFPQIGNSWCHIETRRVNRFARDGERLAEVEIDVQRFAREYKNVRKGQFFTGHIPYQDDLIEYLISDHVKSMFILRDPRDLVLSNLYYILGLKRHYLHSFFAETFALTKIV